MSHTPTPYRVGKSYGGVVANIPENADDRRIEPDHMEAYGGYIVCESCTPEDARFIVEACNENQGLHDTIATLATTIERVHKERDALKTQVESVVAHTEAAPTDHLPIHVFQACLKALALCKGGKE
jgi:hypothetical protein